MPSVLRNGPVIYLNSGGVWYQYDERKAPLGAGAMGTVYLGSTRDGKQRVAIKRVKDQYSNVPEIRERAKLEASLKFGHSNLVEMLGYCELMPDRGPIFIISKFVQGVNIDEFVSQAISRTDPNREKKVCNLFFPVLDALRYLHDSEICHLDIKPSNIMVQNGNNVRLMDLGIAQTGKPFDSGGTMGTPQYAAPEQFSNSTNGSNELRPYTDVYQAGVTLYELITGANPFKAQSLRECILKHKNVLLPESLSISNPVLNVLRKAVSHNLADRYSSVDDFRNALKEALVAKPKKSFWSSILPW